MILRQSHIPRHDTAERLLAAKEGVSWRDLADQLGYGPGYFATLNKVARRVPGSISRQGEQDLRKRLGLRTKREDYRSIAVPANVYAALVWRKQVSAGTWGELFTKLLGGGGE